MRRDQAVSGVLALLAGVVGVACTVPYVRDTLRRTTIPHRGTWLIWSVLGLVATEAQRADGATWSLVPMLCQTAGSLLVLGLSVPFGRGGLSRLDGTLLTVAGLGVAGWQVAEAPVVATTCVIITDLIAVLMMLPKVWHTPHSETLSMFVLAALGGALTAASVGSPVASLLLYPCYFFAVNAALAALIAWRRSALHGLVVMLR